MEICPNCRRRITRQFYDTDYVHKCNSGRDILDTENVYVMSDWIDFANDPEQSSGTRGNKKMYMLQGIVNRLQGTIGGIEGEDVEPMNIFGKRKSTHRTRQKYTYTKFLKKELI
jgi:hypothetical protein